MSVTIPVVSTSDVLDGTARIEGTRVSVQRVGTRVREHGWSRGKVSDEFNLTVKEILTAVDLTTMTYILKKWTALLSDEKKHKSSSPIQVTRWGNAASL